MKLHFATGSDNKVREISQVLGGEISLVKIDADLPELQSMDPREVIALKLEQARKLHPDIEMIIVEDTSFCVDALFGLPGTLVKHFLGAPKAAGVESARAGAQLVYEMARGVSGDEIHAFAEVHIGLIDRYDKINFFVGRVAGLLVEAGDYGWGFDRILVPDGYSRRLGDLGPEIKSQISHRALAAKALKQFLLKSQAEG